MRAPNLFLFTFLLCACTTNAPLATSSPSSEPSVTPIAPTPTLTTVPRPTTTATLPSTTTPTLAAAPLSASLTATPGTAHYGVFQTVCFSPAACVYESLAPNPGGTYLPSFRFSSQEGGATTFAKYISAFSFAHFANRLAYWTGSVPSELWVADIDYRHPERVYIDNGGQYAHIPDGEGIVLNWSPDDLHLMVEVSDHSAPDLIYDIQTGLVETWPWECDRVGISPRSKRLATWCLSAKGESRYAIMEWGGDIWYSDQAPTSEIVRGARLSPGRYRAWLRPWAWSADGEQVAFFDPADQSGSLHVFNASRERLRILPGSVVGLGSTEFPLPKAIQWSQDGQYLLANAYGHANHPCVQYPGATSEAPCWQVIYVVQGSVAWTLADSAKTFGDIADWTPIHAAISPDGKLVAITFAKPPSDTGVVINIATEALSGIDAPVNAMRWGLLP